MNPRRIRARNYRTFETLELDLPDGLVAITGPNGAGKSSLVNVIDLALFGPEGRSWAPYLTQGAESTELLLELELEHNADVYRVRRGYSARGKGKATLDLERGPEWDPLTRETIDATEALIVETFGLTRETFRASSFLAQGDGAAFTEAAPRDRKRILAAVLGLERYDRLLELVRRDARAATAKIDRLEGSLERARADLERLPAVRAARDAANEQEARAVVVVQQAERNLADAAERVTRLEASREAYRERELAIAAAEALLEPIARAWAAADTAAEALSALEQRAAADPDPIATLAVLVHQEAELVDRVETYRADVRRRQEALKTLEQRTLIRNTILGQASELNERAHGLRAEADLLETNGPGSTACGVCGQTLGAEALAATVAHHRTDADELDAAAADLDVKAAEVELPEIPPEPEPVDVDDELASVRDRMARAREAELESVRLEERAAGLRKTIDARPSAEEREQARAAVLGAREALALVDTVTADDVHRARDYAGELSLAVNAARDRVNETGRILARQTAEVERLEALELEARREEAERDRVQVDRDELAILERAYGRDGIPAMIVENAAVPSIETTADRILTELGVPYRVELRTERALAGGRTTDALDVIVKTDAGERPYETFSGGERTRINLALRIGLARLLAHRRGAESRLLAIDEPEYLDEAGTAALARVLDTLTGDFAKVYLISHVPELRDVVPTSLEIVRPADRSEVR